MRLGHRRSRAPLSFVPFSNWSDLWITGAAIAIPGRAPVRADVLVKFEQPLLERGATIAEIGDLGHAPDQHAIDAAGLYLIPMPRSGAASQAPAPHQSLQPDAPPTSP